ncbi:MAG TPA: hypothetical protein VJ044_05010 [Candidatus Hodarchaeales archaeon]|nr:hypothetical protein [Candidatus Hodarchaeales archaeon]
MTTPIEKLAIQNLNEENEELVKDALERYRQMSIELAKYKYVSGGKTPEELADFMKEIKERLDNIDKILSSHRITLEKISITIK